MSCVIKDCKNIRRLMPVNSGISFHRFPKNDIAYKKWLKNLNMDTNTPWRSKMYVCSNHFDPTDFITISPRKLLSALAIPSLNRSARNQINASTYFSLSTTKVLPLQMQNLTESRTSQNEDLDSILPDNNYSLLTFSSQLRKRRLSSSESSDESDVVMQKKLKNRFEYPKIGTSVLRRDLLRIKIEHSYSQSPREVKKQLEIMKLKYNQFLEKEHRSLKQTKCLKKRIQSLKDVLKDGNVKKTLSTSAAEELDALVSAIPAALMRRMLTDIRFGFKTPREYPEELQKFAVTLHFYSPKAYDYVRKTFNLSLPYPSILRKWSSSVDCDPGFSKPSFDLLKNKVDDAAKLGNKIICSLLLDAMSIKTEITFDGAKNWGYINIGVHTNHCSSEIASEALVIMVVSQNASWKLPIGYFLIKSLNGLEKAQLISEAITRLDEVGVNVTSVTCDGPNANFTMFKHLGCQLFSVENLQTFFNHPTKHDQKIYAVFDVCPLLKLIRNCLADLKIIKDKDGEEINWQFIQKLYDFQEHEDLQLANKLGKRHLQWHRQKMKVNLAAQTLSGSVAEALLFLKNDMNMADFQDCGPTVKFLQIVDKAFDLLNSRIPWAKGFKAPLRIENEHVWKPFLLETIQYLSGLTTVEGTPLWKTQRKTPFLGFIISIKSVINMFDDWVVTRCDLKYLLTYRVSQDHLEMFFCAIRSRNGWNNNPSCLQFMRSYRKLLLHTEVSDSDGANCSTMDTTSILSINCGTKIQPHIQHVDLTDFRRYGQNLEIDNNFDETDQFIELSELTENIVSYMGGYVLKMLHRTTRCSDCLDIIVANENDKTILNYKYMNWRNLGPYLYPSPGVFKICCEVEIIIKQIMFVCNNSLPSQALIKDIVALATTKLFDQLPHLFSDHHVEHLFILFKNIVFCYCKIRLNNLSKKYTENILKDLVRRKLTKLILFSHQ